MTRDAVGAVGSGIDATVRAITVAYDAAGRMREVLSTLDEPPPVAGYFVIDSSNHTRWLGLTKDEFDARCKALGIVPKLKRPSSFKK